MLTTEQIREIDDAQDILMSIYWDIREKRGCKAEAKRLDTIIGKLDILKGIAWDAHREADKKRRLSGK